MKFLLDSDFTVGIFSNIDIHHAESTRQLHRVQDAGDTLYILNLVYFEVATVLSHRVDMKAAGLFYNNRSEHGAIKLDMSEELEELSWKIFF